MILSAFSVIYYEQNTIKNNAMDQNAMDQNAKNMRKKSEISIKGT